MVDNTGEYFTGGAKSGCLHDCSGQLRCFIDIRFLLGLFNVAHLTARCHCWTELNYTLVVDWSDDLECSNLECHVLGWGYGCILIFSFHKSRKQAAIIERRTTPRSLIYNYEIQSRLLTIEIRIGDILCIAKHRRSSMLCIQLYMSVVTCSIRAKKQRIARPGMIFSLSPTNVVLVFCLANYKKWNSETKGLQS